MPFEITEVEIDPNNWVLNGVDTVIHKKNLDLKVYLEGAYDIFFGVMKTNLNPGFIPLNQPYNQPPWDYAGSEALTSFPTETVDWLLIELHDASNASLISAETLIEKQAVLVNNDGSINGVDINYVQFFSSVNQQLYIVLKHRNHLGIASAFAAPYTKGVYSYDFSTGDTQVLGGSDGYKELDTGVWGMIGGDANADGTIDGDDKSVTWESSAGENSYLQGDLNLDSQANNQDKDDYWLPNNGKSTQVPY